MLLSKTFRVYPRLLTFDLKRAKRSKLETIYRRSRRPSDFQSFKKQSIINKLISDSHRSYLLLTICESEPMISLSLKESQN